MIRMYTNRKMMKEKWNFINIILTRWESQTHRQFRYVLFNNNPSSYKIIQTTYASLASSIYHTNKIIDIEILTCCFDRSVHTSSLVPILMCMYVCVWDYNRVFHFNLHYNSFEDITERKNHNNNNNRDSNITITTLMTTDNFIPFSNNHNFWVELFFDVRN